MIICFNFASRSRPKRFFNVLENIRHFISDKNYFVVAKLDSDDNSMLVEQARLKTYPEVIIKWGISQSKIHAINRGLENLPHWDILVNVSDDQLFIINKFDEVIKNNFITGDSINLDQFLHFVEPYAKSQSDKHGGKEVCVMSIMGRKYYERDKYIYNPSYYSLFCDEEATAVAKLRGCYKYIGRQIFNHRHYSQSDVSLRVNKDALYIRNDTYKEDEIIFKERQSINFGL